MPMKMGTFCLDFFGVFLPLRTTFAQKRCSEYPLESFMTVLEGVVSENGQQSTLTAGVSG